MINQSNHGTNFFTNVRRLTAPRFLVTSRMKAINRFLLHGQIYSPITPNEALLELVRPRRSRARGGSRKKWGQLVGAYSKWGGASATYLAHYHDIIVDPYIAFICN